MWASCVPSMPCGHEVCAMWDYCHRDTKAAVEWKYRLLFGLHIHKKSILHKYLELLASDAFVHIF